MNMNKVRPALFFAALIALIFSACGKTESEIPSAGVTVEPAAASSAMEDYTEKTIGPVQYLLGVPGEYNFTFLVSSGEKDGHGLLVSCNVASSERFPYEYTLVADAVVYTPVNQSVYFDEAGEVTKVYAEFSGLDAGDLPGEVYINVTSIMEKQDQDPAAVPEDTGTANQNVTGILDMDINGGAYWGYTGLDPETLQPGPHVLDDEITKLLAGYCRKYGYNISITLYKNTEGLTYKDEPLEPDLSAAGLMEKYAADPKYSVCMIYLGERNDASVFLGDPDFPAIDAAAVEAAFCDETVTDPAERVIAAIELFADELEEAVGPTYLNISFEVEDFVLKDGNLSGKIVIDLGRATDALLRQIEDSGAPEEFFAPSILLVPNGMCPLPVTDTEIIEEDGRMSKIALTFSTDMFRDDLSEEMTGAGFFLEHVANPAMFAWSD